MESHLRDLAQVDRVIHEPARLVLLCVLYGEKDADFPRLQQESGLTKGNLSSHLAKLEAAGYVEVEKTYRGKMPLTLWRLTRKGRAAFEDYRKTVRAALKKV